MRGRRRRRGRRLRPGDLAGRGPRLVGAALGRPPGRAGARRRPGRLAAPPATRSPPRCPRRSPGRSRCAPARCPCSTPAGRPTWPGHGVLLDARTPERYRGETEPIDRVAGHVPGSVNLPMPTCSPRTAASCPPTQIRRRAAAAGVHRDTPVGTSCGSGVTAAQLALALHTPASTRSPTSGRGASGSRTRRDPWRPGRHPEGRLRGARRAARARSVPRTPPRRCPRVDVGDLAEPALDDVPGQHPAHRPLEPRPLRTRLEQQRVLRAPREDTVGALRHERTLVVAASTRGFGR